MDKPVTPTQANRDCQSPQGDNRNQSPERDALVARLLRCESATLEEVVATCFAAADFLQQKPPTP